VRHWRRLDLHAVAGELLHRKCDHFGLAERVERIDNVVVKLGNVVQLKAAHQLGDDVLACGAIAALVLRLGGERVPVDLDRPLRTELLLRSFMASSKSDITSLMPLRSRKVQPVP
jgi:hypothetical protein